MPLKTAISSGAMLGETNWQTLIKASYCASGQHDVGAGGLAQGTKCHIGKDEVDARVASERSHKWIRVRRGGDRRVGVKGDIPSVPILSTKHMYPVVITVSVFVRGME